MATSKAIPAGAPMATRRIVVPKHVVFRSFPAETVVLNLETGKYHGLNPTAGKMLEALSEAGSVRSAAARIALEYRRDQGAIEADMCNLCQALAERGLVEIDAARPG
jgi:hypothetical protein